MQIRRVYTSEGENPFDRFKYEKYDCKIVNLKDGRVVLEVPGVEVPVNWSKAARDTFVRLYLRKGGIPTQSGKSPELETPEWLWRWVAMPLSPTRGETSVQEVIHRMVGHWTYTGYKTGYFDPTDDQVSDFQMECEEDSKFKGEAGEEEAIKYLRRLNARAFYDENVFIMLAQIALPNSPQFFNTGLWWAYGMTGAAQGHWYVDSPADTRSYKNHIVRIIGANGQLKEINGTTLDAHNQAILEAGNLKQSPDAYSRTQGQACFILNVVDSMCESNGILDWYEREARIFKYGSGAGANLSKLRGKNEPLTGGGKSSGVMSFIEVADRSAGAIKSGGVTRRAAKLVALDLDHPDIIEFIRCKIQSEMAVASLYTGSLIIRECCQALMDAVAQAPKLVPGTDVMVLDNEQKYPEIVEAINNAREAGVPENYIVKAMQLVGNGIMKWPGEAYSYEFNGNGYELVPFQNANNSVRIPSSFYDAVDKDQTWKTTWRTSGLVAAEIPAWELEQQIAEATWICGDPAPQFDTIINDWNHTPNDGRINGSNPCSEHMRPDGSGCNLASLRLTAFFGNTGLFRLENFQHVVRLWQIILDITNTMSHLPDAQTAMGVHNWRDTGLGYMDLGALLMQMGLPYDSDEARAVAGAVTAIHGGMAYLTSAEMAEQLGAYPRFWANRDADLRVCHNHIAAWDTVPYQGLTVEPQRLDFTALSRALPGREEEAKAWYVEINAAWQSAYRIGEHHGFRNAEKTMLAPTGTTGIVADAETTGVEPMYALVTFKELSGGGQFMQEPSKSVKICLERLHYGQQAIEYITQWISEHGDIPTKADKDAQTYVRDEHVRIFETAGGSRPLPWQAHVKMMAAVQPFLCGAISKTVNMPVTATVEDIKKAMRMAHDLGVKSIAIYRDQCKLSQPLTAKTKRSKVEKEVVARAAATPVQNAQPLGPEVPPGGRVKLDWFRTPGVDVRVTLGPGNLYLHTTRYPNGKTAEIWATYSADQGLIQAMISTACRLANVALQWGVPLEEIISTLADTNFEPNGLVANHPYIKTTRSLMDLLAKLLDYHELGNTDRLTVQPSASLSPADEEVMVQAIQAEPSAYHNLKLTGETCPACGSQMVLPNGSSCKKCMRCGHSGGCG